MLLTKCFRFPRLISTVIPKDRGNAQLLSSCMIKFSPSASVDCYKMLTRKHWSGRKHSKVFKANSEGKLCEEHSESETLNKLKQSRPADRSENNYHEPKQNIFPLDKTVHSFGGVDFVTLKDEDPTFSKSVTEVRNRKQRKKSNIIMLEGKRLNQDALKANLVPKKIFFNDKSFLTDLEFPENMKVPLFKVSYKVIKLWSQLDTPPGIVGFYQMPKPGEIRLQSTLPLRVVCDNVRDPGNLGSILRVSAAVGCTQLDLIKGCTDPWDSKVLRAAAGAHFHLPLRQEISWSEMTKSVKPGESVFVADSQVARVMQPGVTLSQTLYHNVDFTRCAPVVVVIGGETEGVSEDALTLAAQRGGSRLHIPLSNSVESLNSGCALSVLLFEIKRQLLFSEREQVVSSQ